MKKNSFILITLATISLFSLNACDTITDKLFQSFVTNSFTQDFTVDIVTTTAVKQEIGTIQTSLNLDSIIMAETGGSFGLGDISSINVDEITLTILNPDADNNFANFEEGWVNFSTNTGVTPIQIATGMNPDVFSALWNLPFDNSINLKDYLKGTVLNYVISAKARRPTTKALNCKISFKFKVN